MDPCAKEILDKIPAADKEYVEQMVAKMRDIKRSAFLDGITNPDSKYREMAQKELDGFRRAVVVSKIKTVQNILVYKKLESYISNPIFEKTKDNLGTLTFKPSAACKGLEAILVGSNDPKIAGSGESVDAIGRSIVNTLSNTFFQELEPKDIDVVRGNQNYTNIIVEQWDLAHGGKGGVTGDSVALRIAKARHVLNAAERTTYNDSGAFINDLEGHIGRQNWSADKLRKIGEAAWVSEMLDHIDIDKMENRDIVKGDAKEILSSSFKKITEGGSAFITGNSDNVIKINGMPSNVAARLESGRSIFFKDGQSAAAMLKKYGRYDNMGDEILANINSTARNSALMQKAGDNPKATIERFMKEKNFSKPEQNWINQIVANLDGSTSLPGESMAAKASQAYLAASLAVRMGTAPLTHIGDLARRGTNMSLAGYKGGFLGPTGDAIASIFSNLTKEDKIKASSLTSSGADHLIGAIRDKLSGIDGSVGVFSKTMNFVQKMSGLNFLMDTNRASQAMMLSKHFGSLSDMPYASLGKDAANTLNRYSIGPIEWDLLRKTTENGLLSFNKVTELPVDTVLKTMKDGGLISDTSAANANMLAERFQRRTSQRMATLFTEETRFALNEPGAYTRTILNRGSIQDSAPGIAMRLISQFKSFPIEATSGTLDRVMLSGGSSTWSDAIKNGDAHIPALANLIIGSTVLGYVSMAAKAYAKNQTPPDVTDAKTITEAMLHGGAGGMYADFLLGEFDSRMGRNALKTVLGPAGADFSDTMDLYSAMKSGAIEPDDSDKVKARKQAARDAFNVLVTKVPNVFYTKAALDYFVLNGMREYMSHGYLKRQEKNMQKEGQQHIINPNEQAQTVASGLNESLGRFSR
jgi:hypothetical protein